MSTRILPETPVMGNSDPDAALQFQQGFITVDAAHALPDEHMIPGSRVLVEFRPTVKAGGVAMIRTEEGGYTFRRVTAGEESAGVIGEALSVHTDIELLMEHTDREIAEGRPPAKMRVRFNSEPGKLPPGARKDFQALQADPRAVVGNGQGLV